MGIKLSIIHKNRRKKQNDKTNETGSLLPKKKKT